MPTTKATSLANTASQAADAIINGVTVGKGGGAVASNSAVGYQALNSNTTGTNGLAIGYQALYSNTTYRYNHAVGYQAGYNSNGGEFNNFFGWNAGYGTAGSFTGGSNCGFGLQACSSLSSGTKNIGFGNYTLNSTTTGGYNTAIGDSALYSNTTASNNTAVGYQAGYSNTTGANQNYFGYQAGYANQTGDNNTAMGDRALRNNTNGNNVAFGAIALYSNTSGTWNTGLGVYALSLNTTGISNTGVGFYALASNTTGSNNIAVGSGANYTGSALFSNTTGSNNVAMGLGALFSNTTASNNTAVGYQCAYSNTTGTNNTFVGHQAGYFVTTGSKNTIIGRYDGTNAGLDIRTASNYIVLSDGDGNPKLWINSSGTMQSYANINGDVAMYMNNAANSSPFGFQMTFNNAAPNNSSQFFFLGVDNAATRFVAMSNGGIKNYQANNVNLSDEREKKDIVLAGKYLDKLCQVPVKTFLYNDQTDTEINVGVIAQDLQAICPELVTEENWALKDEPEKLRLSVYETDLKYAMLKAIQELNAKLEAQALEIATLKGK